MAQLESQSLNTIYKVVTLRNVPGFLWFGTVSQLRDGIKIISSLFCNPNCLLADESSSELCSYGTMLRGIPQ